MPDIIYTEFANLA